RRRARAVRAGAAARLVATAAVGVARVGVDAGRPTKHLARDRASAVAIRTRRAARARVTALTAVVDVHRQIRADAGRTLHRSAGTCRRAIAGRADLGARAGVTALAAVARV